MANNRNPSYKLTGINPLAYLGVEPYTPPGLIIQQRQPTINDANFNIGQLWVIRDPKEIWMLVQLNQGVPATWVQLYPGSGGGGATSFPTDLGTASEVGGVLNVFGTSPITTTGAGNTVTVLLENGSDGQVIIGGGAGPAWANLTAGPGITITDGPNSITIESTDGEGIDSIDTDSGSVAPVAGTIQIIGDNLINTSGAGNVLTVALDLSLDGQLPIGSSSGPTVMANITSGDGSITVTNGSNTIDIAVTGAMASEYVADTGSAVPAAGILNVLGSNVVATSGAGDTLTVDLDGGLDGQIPIAASAGSAEWAYITSGDGSITITNGPNTIDLVTAGGGGGGFTTKLTKFTSSGTWTKSANAKTVSCIIWGGGHGGGSGSYRVVQSTIVRNQGGGGGAVGSITFVSDIPADNFSATESVIVGAGGAGGAAVVSIGNVGNAGSIGGTSSFANLTVFPYNLSGPGAGGNNPTGGGGSRVVTINNNIISQPDATGFGLVSLLIGRGGTGGQLNGSTSVATAALPNSAAAYPLFPGGGGGGGYVDLASVSQPGAAGASIYAADQSTLIVSGGSIGAPNGGNGNPPVNTHGLITGGSGGGGGLGAGGNGGNGGIPSGGGGGGGGSSASPSGAGGAGARGEVWVMEDISGSSANRGAFLAYLNSNTVRNLPGSTINYLGDTLALTTSFDIDNAFYEGDGSGSEAVYTAPVTGIYYFSLDVMISRPASSSTVFYPIAIIAGPDFNVAGQVDVSTLPTNASGQMGTVNTYLSLNAGDQVRFGVSVSTFNNYGLLGPEAVDNILTQAFTTKVSGGLIG